MPPPGRCGGVERDPAVAASGDRSRPADGPGGRGHPAGRVRHHPARGAARRPGRRRPGAAGAVPGWRGRAGRGRPGRRPPHHHPGDPGRPVRGRLGPAPARLTGLVLLRLRVGSATITRPAHPTPPMPAAPGGPPIPPRRRRLVRAALTLVPLALGLGGLASPGAAQTTAAPASTPVMVVLDASDSMTKADAPGPRIDAAKGAIGDLVQALPDEAKVGLMAFGTSTGPTKAD